MQTIVNSEKLEQVFVSLERDADKLSSYFYKNLTKRAPELSDIFSDSTDEINMFCEVVRILREPPEESLLKKIGRTHKYISCIEKKHFYLFSVVMFSIVRSHYNGLMDPVTIVELDTRIDYVVDTMRIGFSC